MTSQPASSSADTVKAPDSTASPAQRKDAKDASTPEIKVKRSQRTFGVASWFTRGYDRVEVDDFFSRAQYAYEAAKVVPAGAAEATSSPSAAGATSTPAAAGPTNTPAAAATTPTAREAGVTPTPAVGTADVLPAKGDVKNKGGAKNKGDATNPSDAQNKAGAKRRPMTAEDVRRAAFTLRRRGYAVAEVDAALDRLEDALSVAEREALLAGNGEDALIEHLTSLAETLRGRLERPDGERFARGIRGWERTYDVREVDALCHRLSDYFAGVEEMSVDEVRRAAFRGRRGNLGYREPVVDAFLDRVVTVMSAVD